MNQVSRKNIKSSFWIFAIIFLLMLLTPFKNTIKEWIIISVNKDNYGKTYGEFIDVGIDNGNYKSINIFHYEYEVEGTKYILEEKTEVYKNVPEVVVITYNKEMPEKAYIVKESDKAALILYFVMYLFMLPMIWLGLAMGEANREENEWKLEHSDTNKK